MKKLYKILALFLLVSALTLAGNGRGKYTKSKKLSKQYSLNADGMVKISNSFGNVTITTWDQPQVTFEILVEVNGDDESKVEKRLKEIDVRFNSSTDMVEARTFNGENSSDDDFSFWDLFKSNSNSGYHGKVKIDYVVKMPITASLDLSNDYGAVIIDKLEGRADISCDYGRLDIGQLMSRDNELSFDYTRSSHIDYMKAGIIRADFSDFDLYGCEQLEFKGDYTKARLHKTARLNYKADFGTVETEESISVVGRADYTTSRLGMVSEKLDMTTDFGTLKVQELGKDIKMVSVRSDYTTIDLNYHRDANFRFDIDTEFASINTSSDAEITNSSKDHTDRSTAGYVGQSGNSAGTIRIKSEFGSVSLKRN